MNPEEYLEQAKKVSKNILEIYEEQKSMARILFESLKMNGVIQVSQGPTGMGKTLVILAVAKALNDIGKRVLIAAPTYNHLNDNIIQEANLIFEKEVILNRPIMYGRSNPKYLKLIENCPRKEEICKNPLSPDCKLQTNNCIRARDHQNCSNSKIVFTVHAYIVSVLSFMNEFDVVLIDESHGLPDVIRNNTQNSFSIERLEVLINQEQNSEIKQQLESALNYWKSAKKRIIGGKSPPQALIDRIFEPIKKAAIKASENSELSALKYYDLAQVSSEGKLYLKSYRRVPEWNENLSIGLVSATIEDARAHIRDCLFSSLIMRPADKHDTDRFRKRFESRPIFGLIDGPRLGKGDPQNYSIFREEANSIIKELVENTDEITLILCQNLKDAKLIQEDLNKSEKVKYRLTILPEDINDIDSYETLIKKEIKSGKTAIIATASSRLWEGANVPELKFLIIDALPYRKLNPDEKNAGGPKRAKTWKNMKRFMLNRIQQGIGRLVRKENEWGIAVIIDNRFYTNKNQYFKELPNYITSAQIFRWIKKDQIVEEVINMISRLKSGKSARKDQEITRFLS